MSVGQEMGVLNAMEPTLAAVGPLGPQPIHWDDLAYAAGKETAAFDDSETLELRVELGRIRIARAAADDLRKGSVLPLDCPAMAPVDLIVGEQLIGRGEPLRLGGKLAFRVVELFTDEEEPQCP